MGEVQHRRDYRRRKAAGLVHTTPTTRSIRYRAQSVAQPAIVRSPPSKPVPAAKPGNAPAEDGPKLTLAQILGIKATPKATAPAEPKVTEVMAAPPVAIPDKAVAKKEAAAPVEAPVVTPSKTKKKKKSVI